MDNNVDKLYKVLDAFEKAGKSKTEINKIRKLLQKGSIAQALEKIRVLNKEKDKKEPTKRKKKKKVIVEKQEKVEDNEEEPEEQEELESDLEEADGAEDDFEEFYPSFDYGRSNGKVENLANEEKDNGEESFSGKEGTNSKENSDGENGKNAESTDNNEKYEGDDYDEEDDYEDDDEDEDDFFEHYGWGTDELNPKDIKYKEEVQEQVSIYPDKLKNEELEKAYVGLLLNNPKLIVKYYIVFEECYFDDQSLLNIYKSILFTEGGKFTPEIAKKGFSFSVDNNETYRQKQELKNEIANETYNPEKVYLELRKLCVLRKSYIEEPREEIQEQIMGIRDYELYDQMSVDEVKAAIIQVSVTQKFKQAVLSENLTDFLEKGENNLTNGLPLPFPILSSVFKGIRKGETMAFAMPSNSGKSRFTIDISAYTAFVHKKKVLVISNEMSEEKMKLCLITTVLNNPEMQKLHGQKISKTEGELLEFKFRPNKNANVEVDQDGFIVKQKNETRKEFVQRLKKVSDEFNKTIAVTDWLNEQINNSIYFINITDHTNDELKKVIMNYYYKEKIEYVFYDTLKTDTANIGNGEEIKRTATILSNLAQNFNMFICSTLQLAESTTMPINLTVNDLAVSRTVKEVLDTLCLIKQIMREDLDKYEYSLKEVDTKFFKLKKYDDPDERYYACVVDKNRAGAKPKLLFNLNLAYNRWNELGYLKLKAKE